MEGTGADSLSAALWSLSLVATVVLKVREYVASEQQRKQKRRAAMLYIFDTPSDVALKMAQKLKYDYSLCAKKWIFFEKAHG